MMNGGVMVLLRAKPKYDGANREGGKCERKGGRSGTRREKRVDD